ncbi:hypothetical protein OH491_04085 [Termitidicoccus mucosus]|uniref:Uncharacterized protein n=1 Tax=Termitidicoccus mucosus TaxID=1184151 RepID=A0A178IPD3_9BACT|nr:hypothetical protein AW736_05515 [Opitutaceae bacterium TSB47]
MKIQISLLLSALTTAHLTAGQSHYEPRHDYSPYVATEFDLGIPSKQMRAAPVNLGDGEKGFVMIFSEDPNVDPAEGSFFFPKHKPIMAVFDLKGKELWRRELTYSIPGVWFIPLLPMDMDRDGIDELYYVNNIGPKPFVYKQYKLERADARTGKVTGQWPWPQPTHNQASSYKWRFSIIGGFAKNGDPIIIAGIGTYRDMRLRAFNADMKQRWEVYYPDDYDGPRASHSNIILDLNKDGSGQFMWGERCISLDDGRELFVLDRHAWYDHSDTVLPIYDRNTGQWDFWTAREKGDDGKVSRAVMFDQAGKHLWEVPDMWGHFHYGWVGNLGPKGERIAVTGRYAMPGDKDKTDLYIVKSSNPSKSDAICQFYDVKTGEELPRQKFPPTGYPVDFNGDGVHEVYYEGALYDRRGEKIFEAPGGDMVIVKHILDIPGEHIMLATPDGKVRIWADHRATDTPEIKKRYADPMYTENVRHSAVGYNNRFPILNY